MQQATCGPSAALSRVHVQLGVVLRIKGAINTTIDDTVVCALLARGGTGRGTGGGQRYSDGAGLLRELL